jgi:hypothetical protein
MLDTSTKPSPIMTGPICMVCDVPMLLARALPFKDEQELHIFECPECRQSQSEIAKFGSVRI